MRIFVATTVLLAFITSSLAADEGGLPQTTESEKPGTFLLSEQPFLTIADVNREAEAWATCSAVYDIAAELYEANGQPATAKQMGQLANGAQLAIMMVMLIDEISEDMDPERFGALWTFAKHSSQSLPDSRRTAIDAEGEILAGQGQQVDDIFFTKVAHTVQVCATNLETQQMYIDTWRELAKSGLLELPNE